MRKILIMLLLLPLLFGSCSVYSSFTGESMLPTIQNGKTILYNTCVPFSSVRIGDIIITNPSKHDALYELRYGVPLDEEVLLVHRVLAKFNGETFKGTPLYDLLPHETFLVTKGDNNKLLDFYFTTEEGYVGRYETNF